MSRRLLIPRSKIEVIPRGRDDAVLGRRTPARTAEVRRRLGVGPGDPLVVAVGRQEPQKGLDVLLQAVPGGAGPAPGRASPRRRARGPRLGVLGDAVRAGRPRRARSRSSACATTWPTCWPRPTCSPSRPGGRAPDGTLLEAMALEAPIVTSDAADAAQTVDDVDGRARPSGRRARPGRPASSACSPTPRSPPGGPAPGGPGSRPSSPSRPARGAWLRCTTGWRRSTTGWRRPRAHCGHPDGCAREGSQRATHAAARHRPSAVHGRPARRRCRPW